MKAQASTSFTEHAREAFRLGRQDRASHLGEAISATGLALGDLCRRLLDEAKLEKFLDVVVEGARTHLVLAAGLTGDLKHNAVAVEISSGECQENVQCGWRERQEVGVAGLHIRNTIYRI